MLTFLFTLLSFAGWILLLILPVLALLRAYQTRAELDRLRRRITDLEGTVGELRAAVGGRTPADAAAASWQRPASRQPGRADQGAQVPDTSPADAASPTSPPLPTPEFASLRQIATPPPLPDFAADAASRSDLERTLGERGLLYAGIVVLLLGVAFFLRYAFELLWLSPLVRVALGAAAGLALLLGGRRLAAAGYRNYGLLVCGTGVVTLYLSVYAALNFYELIGATPAFGLFVAITIAAAVLADREASPSLAAAAVCGGFLTPFLVGGERDAQLTLFTYDAILIAATMFLARRQQWPHLHLVSLVLTILTVAAWADRFYTSAKYLRTELFLTLYCVMFLQILRENLRSPHPAARFAAFSLLAAPIAYHLASVVILNPHGVAFLTYLIGVSAAAVIVGTRIGAPGVRLAAFLLVAVPFYGWIQAHQGAAWLVPTVVTLVAIHLVHLAPHVRVAAQSDQPVGQADVLLVHANGLGLYAALYETLEGTPAHLPAIALLVAAWNGALFAYARQAHPAFALHWLAVTGTLVAVAIALQFDSHWIVVMWGAEAAGVLWVGLRSGRRWLRQAAWILFALAVYRWFGEDVQEVAYGSRVLLNPRALSGTTTIALMYLAAFVHRRGSDAADRSHARERMWLLLAASALTVLVISIEISAFWALREHEDARASLAREVMLSGAWALYAGVLVAVGMRLQYAPIRYFAIGLFAVTLGKVFLVDLGTLGGIYRVAGFLLVGVVLMLVSFLYQRAKATGASSD